MIFKWSIWDGESETSPQMITWPLSSAWENSAHARSCQLDLTSLWVRIDNGNIFTVVYDYSSLHFNFRRSWGKNMVTVLFQWRSMPLSLRSSLEQLRTQTTSNYWKTGSGGMTTQFPPNTYYNQSRHCYLIIVTTRTKSCVRRRLLIGGQRLRECKLCCGWPLTRLWINKVNGISTTCQVYVGTALYPCLDRKCYECFQVSLQKNHPEI